MANEYSEIASRLEWKVGQLAENYRNALGQVKDLKSKVNTMQLQLQEAHTQIAELQKQLDHLKIANALANPDEAYRNAAKEQINKMVRNIDKCLALLAE